MNDNLRSALQRLRPSDIDRLRSELGIQLGSQGSHESDKQYKSRFLLKVESDGKVRELELEMLRFK